MSDTPAQNVYELFKLELDTLTIRGDDPAAAVVGECLRAVKRAQMKFDAAAKEDAERRASRSPRGHGAG